MHELYISFHIIYLKPKTRTTSWTLVITNLQTAENICDMSPQLLTRRVEDLTISNMESTRLLVTEWTSSSALDSMECGAWECHLLEWVSVVWCHAWQYSSHVKAGSTKTWLVSLCDLACVFSAMGEHLSPVYWTPQLLVCNVDVNQCLWAN